MKFRVIVDRTAASEFEEQLDRLLLTHPASASLLEGDVASLLDLVSEFPKLHERYNGELRRAVLPKWSLGIFYRSTPTAVYVVAFLDLRRDPAAIRRRLGLHETSAPFDPGSVVVPPASMVSNSDLQDVSD